MLKLPGLVDVHTHLRDPGAVYKEDFYSGTKAAIAGAFTQILDMPNNNPPTNTPKMLHNKIKGAKNRIWCDVGFNFAATKESTKYFPKISEKAFGLKVYMNKTTGTLLIDDKRERELIFKSWRGKLPIMVHAEGDTVERAIYLAKKHKRKLHVCHITAGQIPHIAKAKKEGIDITCEVCPHHLFLSKEDLKNLGPLAIMKPPLTSRKDNDKLWENIALIDMIASDHAPHSLEEKFEPDKPKFGVPGLETTLPLMLSAMRDKKITLEQIIFMLSTNPRKRFYLKEQKDTYVVVDDSHQYKINENKLFTKCKWSPFRNIKLQGRVVEVTLRGKVVYSKGKFLNKPTGKVIFPN